MKKADIYVFSATGNTMKCAEELRKNLIELGAEAEIKRIESGLERVERTGDTVVICYPVHGFNAPMNVINFCKGLPESGADAYVLKTSGEPLSINDDSSARLIASLKKKGYAYKGEFHFVMPYNMIFRHSDEMAAKMFQTAKRRMPSVAEVVFEGEEHSKKVSMKAKIVRGVVGIEHWGARVNGRFFTVDTDKCVKCMKCVKNCPTENISYENGKFKFGGNCLLCTRCSFNCPTDAFKIGIMEFMHVNGKYNFNADPDKAVIGKYCRKAYVRYFGESENSFKAATPRLTTKMS